MLEKAAQKLLMAEGHHAALAVMRIILPSKRHVSVGHLYKSMVGDRDAMRVASQILTARVPVRRKVSSHRPPNRALGGARVRSPATNSPASMAPVVEPGPGRRCFWRRLPPRPKRAARGGAVLLRSMLQAHGQSRSVSTPAHSSCVSCQSASRAQIRQSTFPQTSQKYSRSSRSTNVWQWKQDTRATPFIIAAVYMKVADLQGRVG